MCYTENIYLLIHFVALIHDVPYYINLLVLILIEYDFVTQIVRWVNFT